MPDATPLRYLYVRQTQKEVASGGARGGAARLGGLYEGALQGAPSSRRARPPSAPPINQRRRSLRRSPRHRPSRSRSIRRTRTTTRHETACGFACPLLRDLCPLLLCITPSKIKGRVPCLVYPTVTASSLHKSSLSPRSLPSPRSPGSCSSVHRRNS